MTEAERERAAKQEEMHDAVAVAIADRFLCQPKEMPWEDRTSQLADAAIEAVLIQLRMWRDDTLAIA